MGYPLARHRTIETDDILDAAERVVAREGAAGLSIDAVAKEAGISKSMVVYDHKSKGALLEALIDRQIRQSRQETLDAVTACSDTPHPELFGRIAAFTAPRSQAERAVMMAVCAAMRSDERLQCQMRDWVAEDLAAVARNCERPRAALMAFLALTGFCYFDQLDYHKWSEAQRREILEDIRRIFPELPEPAAA